MVIDIQRTDGGVSRMCILVALPEDRDAFVQKQIDRWEATSGFKADSWAEVPPEDQ